MERDNPEPKSNGNSPYFLVIPDGAGDSTHIFGPYSRDFAECLQEEFGGTIIKEEVHVTKDGKR